MESVLYCNWHELKVKEEGVSQRTLVVHKFDNKAQMVRLDMIDENDAFFLYSLTIAREDYLAMQREQNLRTAFEKLPEAIVWQLRRNKEENTKVYMTVNYPTNATLSLEIREVHSMRDVVLVSLPFHRASTAEIQQRVELVRKMNEERIKLLENTNEELNKRLESSEENVNRLTADLNDMKEKHVTVLNEHQHNLALLSQRSEYEKEKLIEDLTKNHEEKLEEFNCEKNSLQAQLESIKNEKTLLEKDVSILRARIREEHIKKEAATKQVKEMEKDLTTLRSKIQITSERTELMTKQYQSLNAELEETKRLLEVTRRNEDQLKQQLSNFATRNCRLEELIEHKSKKLEYLSYNFNCQKLQIQQKTAELEMANEKLRNVHNDISQLKSDQRTLRQEAEDGRQREAALRRQISEMEKHTATIVKGLQKEMEQMKQTINNHKSFEDKQSNLQKLLDIKDGEIVRLKKELDTLKNKKGDAIGGMPFFYNQSYMQESNHPAVSEKPVQRPIVNIPEESSSRLGRPEKILESNHPAVQEKPAQHLISNMPEEKSSRLALKKLGVVHGESPTRQADLPLPPLSHTSKSALPSKGLIRKK